MTVPRSYKKPLFWTNEGAYTQCNRMNETLLKKQPAAFSGSRKRLMSGTLALFSAFFFSIYTGCIFAYNASKKTFSTFFELINRRPLTQTKADLLQLLPLLPLHIVSQKTQKYVKALHLLLIKEYVQALSKNNCFVKRLTAVWHKKRSAIWKRGQKNINL